MSAKPRQGPTQPDAVALAAMVRAGEVTPGELVERAISRAEAVNPQLIAIVEPAFEAAREAAWRLHPSEQLLAGVPTLLKDLFCPVAGEPAYQGNRVLRERDHRYSVTGAVGRRLARAGAISLGRSHSPEFGCGNCTAASESVLYGTTRNPWDPSRTAMGSSGGAAAAVAAGIVPLAHASDGGGSIRLPAAACGVVGLKPSRARVSSAPDGEIWAGGVCDGVVSRTVRDTALALDVLAGGEPGDPYAAPPFHGSYLAELQRPPEPLRVGLCTGLPFVETAPCCREAVLGAGRALEALGHRVEESYPEAMDSLDYMYDYIRVIRASLAVVLERTARAIGHRWSAADMEDGTWINYRRGLKLSAVDYASSLERNRAWTRQVVGWWAEGHQLLVLPTLATLPPRAGFLVERDERERIRRLAATMPFTAQFNVTGQPAISLPLASSDDGVPIGVQLVAAPGREDLLLRVAAQLETVLPWSERRPRIEAA